MGSSSILATMVLGSVRGWVWHLLAELVAQQWHWVAVHVKGGASQPVFGWRESVSHSMWDDVRWAGIAAPGGGRLGGVHLG